MSWRGSATLCAAGYGVLTGWRDYRAMFTWQSWLFGWLARLLCQVLFFSSLGVLLGSESARAYLAVGHAAALAALGAFGVVSSTVGERRSGTLAFLLVSDSNVYVALAARGAYWLVDGVVTAAIALALVPLAVGVPVSGAYAGPILLLLATMGLAAYQLGLALATLSLRWPEARTYLSAGATIALLLFAGVNRPVADSGLPAAVAHVLPVTHGLSALRGVLSGDGLHWGGLLAEACVALGWGAVAYLSLNRSLRHAARRGSLAVG
ncbi:ABC transporter permease [Pilimelia terevasa]|uniref:ABC transporter permease n=1 Tax=Pilimelia terevasa TaxID=53372 RepID=UPI00166E57E9|nr:ABC transporter permease [Pilimelia terevasa]